MKQIEQQLSLYHTLYMVFLILCILLAAISIFLFIRFDIRNIFNVKTGRAVKKASEEMREKNSRTGRLRRQEKRFPNTGKLREEAGIPRVVNPAPATAPLPEQAAEETSVLEYQIDPKSFFQQPAEDSLRIRKTILYIHTEEEI